MKVTYLTVFCLCVLARYSTASASTNPPPTQTTSPTTKAKSLTTKPTSSPTKATSPTVNTGNSAQSGVNAQSTVKPLHRPSKTQASTTTTTPKPYNCAVFNCEGKGCSKNISTTCVGTGKSCQITSITNVTVTFDAKCVPICTEVTTANTKTRCCKTSLCNQESLLTTQPSQNNGAIYWSSCTFVLVTIQVLASILLK